MKDRREKEGGKVVKMEETKGMDVKRKRRTSWKVAQKQKIKLGGKMRPKHRQKDVTMERKIQAERECRKEERGKQKRNGKLDGRESGREDEIIRRREEERKREGNMIQ